MTYTLELPENVERVLEAKARRRGVALDVYLREVLRRDAENSGDALQNETRREAVRASFGKFAHVSGTVADFMRERSECDGL